MCACGKNKKTDAITSAQASAIVAAGVETSPDEIRKINSVREQRSVNNAAANASS